MTKIKTPETTGRLVEVGSLFGGNGKTLVATNLAVLLSQAGKKVLLADLNPDGGSLEQEFIGIFPREEGRGVSALLRWAQGGPLQEFSPREVLFFATEVNANLWFLPGLFGQREYDSKDGSLRRTLLARTSILDNYIEAALNQFDFVIIDKGINSYTSLGNIGFNLAERLTAQPTIFIRLFDYRRARTQFYQEKSFVTNRLWPASAQILNLINLLPKEATDLANLTDITNKTRVPRNNQVLETIVYAPEAMLLADAGAQVLATLESQIVSQTSDGAALVKDLRKITDLVQKMAQEKVEPGPEKPAPFRVTFT